MLRIALLVVTVGTAAVLGQYHSSATIVDGMIDVASRAQKATTLVEVKNAVDQVKFLHKQRMQQAAEYKTVKGWIEMGRKMDASKAARWEKSPFKKAEMKFDDLEKAIDDTTSAINAIVADVRRDRTKGPSDPVYLSKAKAEAERLIKPLGDVSILIAIGRDLPADLAKHYVPPKKK